MLRLAILILFFGSVIGVCVFYATHQPSVGRWFLLLLVAAWWLRAKYKVL